MRSFLTAIVGFIPVFFFVQLSTADVCCIRAEISGQNVTTSAIPTSAAECLPGAKEEGIRVCKAMEDIYNICPTLEENHRCTACGFFWSGSACFVENPVETAKKILEEERKKAQEDAASTQ